MPYEIVHTIGSTVYFVFFLLFLWVQRTPRINPGAGWWAVAMLFALAARLALVVVFDDRSGHDAAVAVYASINVIEKFCLVMGLVRFFEVPARPRGFWIALLVIEAWIVLAWAGGISPLLRDGGVALFNAVFQVYAGWAVWSRRQLLAPRLLSITASASLLLALHWATFPFMARMPDWLTQGFMIGTALALTQYFSLLAAVLLSFQKRLLEAESRALDMAFQDPLTGLSNQRYMRTLFENALILAHRPHQLAAVIYIDVDNFKPVNDRAGHRVGDEVLKRLAARLRQSTRSTDICARIGGDEFVAICTQLEDADHAHSIAQKLLREFTAPLLVEGREYVLGASIGVSLYPLHGDTLGDLLECADRAMYQIKGGGKNGYRIHAGEAPA
ncbi:diguanylate cyclase [Stenotrophomonas sp. MYb238]|uniref:GGDEF domain-containing protein n=1 Tax=Stenotrophomonas sp. MYb238 TaxID=2040281 RepID=UPI00129298A4|nr:GGDEF domain-containing protein [Stenotrophomonas sp. MYb238]MQP77306.1 diguanylate cyclase [Stenotrophomonas sp. MYb238]